MIKNTCICIYSSIALFAHLSYGEELTTFPGEDVLNTTTDAIGDGADGIHSIISDVVSEPVIWFDRYFGEETNDARSPGTYVRTIFAATTIYDEPQPIFRFRAKGKVSLPGVSQRWRLVLNGRSDTQEEIDSSITSNNGDQDTESDSIGSGFEYDWMNDPNLSWTHLVGSYADTSGIYLNAQSRLGYLIPQKHENQIRLIQRWFWGQTSGWDFESAIGYEQLLTDSLFYRSHWVAMWREIYLGWIFRHDADFYLYLNQERAISFGYNIIGFPKPAFHAEQYLTYFKFRRRFLRKWFFFELRPEILWENTNHFRGIPRFTIQIESHFGNQAYEEYGPPKL